MRIAIAAVALLLAACSEGDVVKVKDPGPVPDLTTTTAIDYSQIGLKGVASRGTTTVPLGPGGASLRGTVTGPDGPIDQATVHIERLVGNTVTATDLSTLANGTWSLPAILGGRYRVRAWRVPDLAITKPQIFYLQASENKPVDMRLDRFAGASVTASIAPNPPVIGEPTNLFVLVAERRVDAGGVVRAEAAAGVPVDLNGNGYQLETGNPVVTDANGVAEWRVRCTNGGGTLSVTVSSSGSFPLELPACIESSQPPPETSTTARRTTSTTRR